MREGNQIFQMGIFVNVEAWAIRMRRQERKSRKVLRGIAVIIMQFSTRITIRAHAHFRENQDPPIISMATGAFHGMAMACASSRRAMPFATVRKRWSVPGSISFDSNTMAISLSGCRTSRQAKPGCEPSWKSHGAFPFPRLANSRQRIHRRRDRQAGATGAPLDPVPLIANPHKPAYPPVSISMRRRPVSGLENTAGACRSRIRKRSAAAALR